MAFRWKIRGKKILLILYESEDFFFLEGIEDTFLLFLELWYSIRIHYEIFDMA